MATDTSSLGTRTLRGMAWAYGSYVGGKLLVLGSVALLARLLTPSDFGLVALALTFTVLLDALSDLGLGAALVVSSDEEVRERADTAWTTTMLLALAMGGLVALLSPLATAAFHKSGVTPLLLALALNFPLRAAGVTHFALAQRDIDFRTRTVAEMADVVVRGTTGIVLALSGAGAWSLVIGYLAGSASMSTALWLRVPFRPRPTVGRRALRSMLRFGGGLTVLNISSVVVSNVDYVLIGRVLGAAQLGIYTLGFRLPELLIMNLSVVASVVLFPSFAGVDRRALSDAFLTALRYTFMISVPLAVALSVLAGPLVLLLFGDKWTESIPVMRILVLYAFMAAIAIPGGTIYKAIKRVDILLWFAAPQFVISITAIVLVVDRGIVAVALTQAGVTAAFMLLALLVASRVLGVGLRRMAQAVWPPLAAGAAMAGAGFAGTSIVDGTWPTLLVAGAPMAPVYLGVLWLTAPDAIRHLVLTAFPNRTPAAAAS